MIKRVAVVAFWVLAGWYAVVDLVNLTGSTILVGPIRLACMLFLGGE